MKINGEEVELVTSFDQLRTGMIVWVLDCKRCAAGRCRSMITVRALTPNAWRVVPKCVDSLSTHQIVSAEGIAQRGTYRVVDPKLAATTERKREAVRT